MIEMYSAKGVPVSAGLVATILSHELPGERRHVIPKMGRLLSRNWDWLRRRRQWQSQFRHGSRAVRAVLESDMPVVPGTDLPAKNQPDTRSGGFGRIKGHEEILGVADTRTAIGDAKFTLAIDQMATELDGTGSGQVGLHGILDQIDECLLDVYRIAE
jgi:hypothetical protein